MQQMLPQAVVLIWVVHAVNMRISEIILESNFEDSTGAIEDEADSRGDSALITALEWLRHEATESNAVTPRVKVDTVIERVRAIPGNEAFNFAALDAAHDHNDTVKSLIKDIKDDEKTGAKYIYLSLPENTIAEPTADSEQGTDPVASAKIVSKMAANAAK
jgi:hypothetical protein